MNIWINPINFANAKKLIIDEFIKQIYVGLDLFAVRINYFKNIDEIKEICEIDIKKVTVIINKIFVESEINGLEKFLKQLKEMNIKSIMFSDYAVKQICDEINYQPKLTYFNETLVTSYGQFDFFKNNKIDQVVLARELFLREIKEISLNKKIDIQLQIEGYPFIMHSKWNILEQFCNEKNIKIELSNKKMYIKENERKIANIVFEDKHGFQLFGGFNLTAIKYIDQLIEMGIDSFRIDSFMHDEKWIDNTLNIYKKAYKLINEKKWNEKKSDELYQAIKANNIDPISSSFFGEKNDLLHLIKSEVSND